MRCRRVVQLIHLDRGEIPDDLRAAAVKHASSCPRCSEELRLVSVSADPLARIGWSQPVLRDPEGFTRDLMRSIMARESHSLPDRVAGRPLLVLPWRGIRIAFQAAAWCAVAVFLGLSLRDARQLAALEEQSTLRATRTINPAPLAAGLDPGALLAALRISSAGPPSEMARLQRKYPALWTIALDDGIDEQERRIIAADGPSLIADLQDLIRLGGGRNER